MQLHGDETPAFAGEIARPVIKAVAVDEGAPARSTSGRTRVTLLLDAHDREQRGGTGRTIDWTAAARVAAGRRVLLAGGLTPENIGDAIRRVRPFGIEVSSGVEHSPGVKDQRRLKALFDAMR